MAALSYLGNSSGFTPALIQNTFHFDTNQFLIPAEGECSPLDYDDLFSVFKHPETQGSWGSSVVEIPILSSGSGGGEVALPDSPQVPSVQPTSSHYPWSQQQQPQPPQQPQQRRQQSEVKQSKSSRDAISKRTRDGVSGKSKQRQVKELEALAAKKSEDLERLTQENNELKFRSQILEKVVQMRDYQLKVMRGSPMELPQFWGERPPSGTQQHDGTAAAAAGTDGGSRCPSAITASADGSQSAAAMVKMAGCGCLLTGESSALTTEDRARFRSLGKTQLMDTWKHFLAEVAVPLLALESNSEDEQAAAQVRQVAAKAAYVYKHASLLAPDTVMIVSQTHLETDALISPDPGHWHSVVRTLELSPEQVRELRAVFRLFSGVMAGILAERKVINQRLADGTHGHAVDIRAAMEQLTVSPECEMLQALQRSLRREKAAHLLLRGFLFGRTLSVLQFVKAAVYSYPWMPDATAIVATVVETKDAPDNV